MSGSGRGVVMGIFIGNLVYVLFTVVLLTLFSAGPSEAGSSFASDFIDNWMAFGGMLFAIDVLSVLGFVSNTVRY
ncbi:hypothetical protein [Halomarina rubra]|uniref:Uncharacterized protein n=1 Tax=Halomarina rubra TaxID=2071873 RepID=A0ABD6ASH1_9EURY|nr:hypothetical protein [Halomarina rubra]